MNKRVLFIAYTSLTNPIIWSQGIPYLRKIAENGWQVFLLTFERKGVSFEFLSKNKLGKIKWLFLNHWPWLIFPSLLDIIRAVFYCFYLIKKEKIKIVHARSYLPGLIACWLKKLTGIRFIFDPRGLVVEEEIMSGHWQKNSFFYKIAKFFEKKMYFLADVIVVTRESFKNYLAENFFSGKDDKIKVIPIAVETEKFQNSLSVPPIIKNLKDEKKIILVYTGAIEVWHSVDEMADFFLVLKKIIPNFHFLILTYQKKKAEEILSRKFLEKNDYTILKIEPNEVPTYLKNSDLGIVFIKSVFPKNIASMPIKFFEYLAAGLPVVVNSGISEIEKMVIEQKLGVVINNFNHQSYQKAVEDLIALLAERKRIEKEAKRIVAESYNLNLAASKYEEIYQPLIG